MTQAWQRTADPLVLHVIPTSVARGAQREARELADALDAPGRRAHRVLTLFGGPAEVRPDYSLGMEGGAEAGRGFRPLVVPRLRSALAGLGPVAVVAHGGEPLKYLVPAMVGRRRPLAYYAIGTYAGSHRRLQLELWRRLTARVDVIAAEGYEVEAECIELLGVPADRVVMTPNGRDPERFHPRPAGAPARPPLVLFVGALTEGKRPDRFVEVVAALRARGLELRAQLVGGGPLDQSLTAPARDAEVEMLGVRSDVASVLAQADVMVFPSRPAGEGMPGVLIEAGLCGVPVVATDVPGVTTIVSDGETGLVVAQDDLGALVSATAALLEDDDRRTEMGRAARRRCLESFSLGVVAARWQDLLAPLLPTS
jgi:glycosyltransferase involved in cell wall biosynthesis